MSRCSASKSQAPKGHNFYRYWSLLSFFQSLDPVEPQGLRATAESQKPGHGSTGAGSHSKGVVGIKHIYNIDEVFVFRLSKAKAN
jgi:hypothetical protein